MIETLVIILWVACGVLSYGFTLAHFQRRYNCFGMARADRRRDIGFSIVGGIAGPIGLAATLLCGFTNYGWMWRPLPDDEVNDGM